jgi:homoserine O-acetyltransferase
VTAVAGRGASRPAFLGDRRNTMSQSLFGAPRPFEESGLIAETRYWTFAEPPNELPLVAGGRIGPVTVAYQTYGTLNEDGTNAVLVCHSLTGNMHAAGRMADSDTIGWWDPLIGPGRAFDTDRYFVVCANVLGGCGGTTGPASINPKTGKPYGSAFPHITMRDVVNVHAALLQHLGVTELVAVSGPSMGGSQSWEMAAAHPDLVRHCIPVAAAPVGSASLIGWNYVARRAIFSDPDWQGGDYYASGRVPADGLSLAREIHTMTYYSPSYWQNGFGNAPGESADNPRLPEKYAVEEFLDEEGRKLVARFDANSYLHALRSIETMDIGRPFGSLQAAFRAWKSRLLVIGVASDLLFPPWSLIEAVETAKAEGVDARYAEIDSPDGHDACLLEIDRVISLIREFLAG